MAALVSEHEQDQDHEQELPSAPRRVEREERTKSGRAKPPPRAKLTMEMLVGRETGIDALLDSLKQVHFGQASAHQQLYDTPDMGQNTR